MRVERPERISDRHLPAAAAIAIALLTQGCGTRPAAGPRPNVILITVESLRADHCSGYGYKRNTTPSLDALGREGVSFDNAYAVTSWTLPSHASLFTGLYPGEHGVLDFRTRLGDAYVTLAERLHDAGYQTAGFISGPLLQKQYNLHQGFESYDESSSNTEGQQAAHGDVTNPRMEALLTQFLKNGRDPRRPFFLFAYLWDPHYDYIPPPPYDRAFVPPDAQPVDVRDYETTSAVGPGIPPAQLAYVISQYDGEIACTDALLGRLFALLRTLGLWDSTTIVVTADHGEEFFEHGNKGHKRSLYEESLHVPLILKLAGRAEPRRETRTVSLVDVFPTVLELVGLEDDLPSHGRSLLLPPADPQAPVYFHLKSEWLHWDAELGRRRPFVEEWVAVRQGKYKLVWHGDRREVYDLSRDPGERHPLDDPSVSAPGGPLDRLASLLRGHAQAMRRNAARWGPPSRVELTPEMEERLRSLGYLR